MADEPTTQTTTTERTPLPDSVDFNGAVGLMARLPETTPPPIDPNKVPKQPAADADTQQDDQQGAGDTQQTMQDDAGEQAQDQQDDQPQDTTTTPADAPEFWAAEDKAAWAKVPDDVKPLVAKYEAQRNSYLRDKVREASQVGEQAKAETRQYQDVVAKAAEWWKQVTPVLEQRFVDKYTLLLGQHGAKSMAELAQTNPAAWTTISQMMSDDQRVLNAAKQRGDAEAAEAQRIATQRASEDLQNAKITAHDTLRQKMPAHFATPDNGAKTYQELGQYLLSKGIDAERINQIAEAPLIEIATNAMLYERAKTQAASRAPVKPAATAANPNPAQTPPRVTPGPATRTTAANRTSEARRQVSERFRQTGSITDAAALIGANGL